MQLKENNHLTKPLTTNYDMLIQFMKYTSHYFIMSSSKIIILTKKKGGRIFQ